MKCLWKMWNSKFNTVREETITIFCPCKNGYSKENGKLKKIDLPMECKIVQPGTGRYQE
jgi:hypothetical protein